MQFWDAIINTAMMGTEKKQLSATDIPSPLETAATSIQDNPAKDREEKFLQLATLLFNYRQCGYMPVIKEVILTPAAEEEKPYCRADAIQLLKDVISEQNDALIKLWLQHCDAKGLVVAPEMVPVLLSMGVLQKQLRPLISSVCGKRGTWLAGFNSAWNFVRLQTDEELWNTGLPEERLTILEQTFRTDPARAREWLRETWKQEDANTRVSLLKTLTDIANEEDIPFLEGLAADKSKRVQDAALELLKKIPGSSMVRMYEGVLSEAVTLKKEKGLLGLSSKMAMYFRLPSSHDPSIYKTGIDKLSNNKELTDEEYIIRQLIAHVPPSFWESHLQMTQENIIDAFQKDPIGKKMIIGLVLAIVRFRDPAWAFSMMQHSQVFYIDILGLLPDRYQEQYSNKFFEKFPESIIQHVSDRETEWGEDLAINIVRFCAKNPYQYNRAFYSGHINRLPVFIAKEMSRLSPPEAHMNSTWSGIQEHVTKLFDLKSRILQVFNT